MDYEVLRIYITDYKKSQQNLKASEEEANLSYLNYPSVASGDISPERGEKLQQFPPLPGEGVRSNDRTGGVRPSGGGTNQNQTASDFSLNCQRTGVRRLLS